jgi:hypothetical protein
MRTLLDKKCSATANVQSSDEATLDQCCRASLRLRRCRSSAPNVPSGIAPHYSLISDQPKEASTKHG